MQLSDDAIQRWEHIISEVAKTDIPLECIKKVVVKLTGGRQRTINLHKWRRQGMDLDQIETALTEVLQELDSQIRDLDFVVDIAAVAELVQPETDKLLEKLAH
jgi:hypothetical protein